MSHLRLIKWLLRLSAVACGVGAQVQDPTVLPDGDGRSTDIITSYDISIPSSQPSRWPQPTPTLIAFSGYGSGYEDYFYLETTEDATIPSPVSSSTATQRPPDVIIRLRLSFESNVTVEQRTHVGQNLSDIVKDILQLSIPPLVSQESDDVFRLLIVTSSSSFDNITSGDVDVIKTELLSWKLSSRLQGVTKVEIISVARYRDTPLPIDHFAFPLWQWFVYALCAVIATTATLLLICAWWYRCMWKRNPQKMTRPYRGYRHHLLANNRTEEMVNFVEQPSDTEPDPAMMRKVSRISFRPRGPMRLLSHPLTPEELHEFVLNPLAIYMEYSNIPSNMVTMAEVPPGAEGKNRFKDVLPNPHTRVALFLKFAVPNSDYINANYIRGYRDAPKAYIATQGPLHWTVADFWRMIWEQKCSTIIMATGLEEKGITKCARYWPNERVQHMTSYEELELILKRKLTNKHYTITTFHLQHKQKLVTREVIHFWFTAWPDHGVPTTARPVVEFLLKARSHIRDIPGPTVVHCSAGIGRTGVFIGAEIGMQQLEEKGEVDVLKIVSTLRQDRGGMVQTKDQYMFLYQVLAEYAKYLDEVRSPYHHKAASSQEVARQPWTVYGIRRLEPPREEEEEYDLAT